MNKREFSNIFINPLYGEKSHLNKIDTDIYDEILDLSDRFLISSQILNNLIYKKGLQNALIDGLKEQSNISNLKNLINKKEVLKIADLFNKNEIKYVFLKGSAINVMSNKYVRYSRDLDVLVNESSLSKAYELLKGIGYKYLNPLVSDSSEFTKHSYHLPVLSNDDGGLLEIHFRVTDRLIYQECPITESMLNQIIKVNKNGININISDTNHLIAHIIYHAALHHKFDMGPVFLYDIKYLINKINSKKDLLDLLQKMNLDKIYKDICGFIDDKRKTDIFNLYEMSNLKEKNKREPKRFNYLLLTKKGRSDFLNIILRRFTKNEDLYQTSKYSIKFYFILLIEFKNHCLRLRKS